MGKKGLFAGNWQMAINEGYRFIHSKRYLINRRKTAYWKIWDERLDCLAAVFSSLEKDKTIEKYFNAANKKFRAKKRNRVYAVFINAIINYEHNYPVMLCLRISREWDVTFKAVQVASAVRDDIIDVAIDEEHRPVTEKVFLISSKVFDDRVFDLK